MSLIVVRDFAVQMAQGHGVLCSDGMLTLAPGETSGTWISNVLTTTGSFHQAVCSWNAEVPGGMVEVAVQVADAAASWGAWHVMGRWYGAGYAGRPRGSSVSGDGDGWGHVAADTLQLRHPAATLRLRVSLTGGTGQLGPVVHLLACSTDDRPVLDGLWHQEGTSVLLDVPQYSQRSYGQQGQGWCSPTSLAMVLAWWGTRMTVPEVAQAVFDPAYGGTGNWSCNVAYAGDLGYAAYVTHLHTAEQLAWLLGQGLPVIVSVSYGPGALPQAPIDQTKGHLLVVCGLDATGCIVVNDPAGEPNAVRRSYPREAFLRAWLGHGGIAYLIAPAPGCQLPWQHR